MEKTVAMVRQAGSEGGTATVIMSKKRITILPADAPTLMSASMLHRYMRMAAASMMPTNLTESLTKLWPSSVVGWSMDRSSAPLAL
jgi:hypothetical protein